MDFTAQFDAVPAGTHVGPVELSKIWPPNVAIHSIYDADVTHQFFSVVTGGKSGNCFRYLYPKGSYGMRAEFYQIKLGPITEPINVSYDWMFESPFSLNAPGTGNGGGGKLGPCIQWGPVGGDNSLRGTRLMCWWD